MLSPPQPPPLHPTLVAMYAVLWNSLLLWSSWAPQWWPLCYIFPLSFFAASELTASPEFQSQLTSEGLLPETLDPLIKLASPTIAPISIPFSPFDPSFEHRLQNETLATIAPLLNTTSPQTVLHPSASRVGPPRFRMVELQGVTYTIPLDHASLFSVPAQPRVIALPNAIFMRVKTLLIAAQADRPYSYFDVLAVPSRTRSVGANLVLQEREGLAWAAVQVACVSWWERDWVGFNLAEVSIPPFTKLFAPLRPFFGCLVVLRQWCRLTFPSRFLHFLLRPILPDVIRQLIDVHSRITYPGPFPGEPEWIDFAHHLDVTRHLLVAERQERTLAWLEASRAAIAGEQAGVQVS